MDELAAAGAVGAEYHQHGVLLLGVEWVAGCFLGFRAACAFVCRVCRLLLDFQVAFKLSGIFGVRF